MSTSYTNPTLARTNDDGNFDSDRRLGLLESVEGDWIVGSTGSLLMGSTYEVLAQRLATFMQTEWDTAEVFPEFGNRLHEAYGKSIDNPEVLRTARSKLIADLNSAGFFPDESRIEVLAYSGDTILINVAIINVATRTRELVGQSYQFSTGSYAIEFLGAVTY